jgi:hypothetical protein
MRFAAGSVAALLWLALLAAACDRSGGGPTGGAVGQPALVDAPGLLGRAEGAVIGALGRPSAVRDAVGVRRLVYDREGYSVVAMLDGERVALVYITTTAATAFTSPAAAFRAVNLAPAAPSTAEVYTTFRIWRDHRGYSVVMFNLEGRPDRIRLVQVGPGEGAPAR